MNPVQANEKIVVCRLGKMEYEPAWELQRQIQESLIAAKRSQPPVSRDHVLLLVEHPPVYTLGKSGDEQNLLADEAALAARGASFHRVDRGGDITYHGPGQIVGYPLLDLERFKTDIHWYLRNLEEMVIRTCRDYGLTADRVDGRTGVWIQGDEKGPERKICAMGIRCSRWVTMHGFAFNVNTDLSFFDAIVPCGISDRGVTSLSNELGQVMDEDEAGRRLVSHFQQLFGAEVVWKEGSDAKAFLPS